MSTFLHLHTDCRRLVFYFVPNPHTSAVAARSRRYQTLLPLLLMLWYKNKALVGLLVKARAQRFERAATRGLYWQPCIRARTSGADPTVQAPHKAPGVP